MKRTINYAAGFFLWAFVPTTLLYAANTLLLERCDPKFGCWGTFELGMLIVFSCVLVATIAAFVSHLQLASRTEWRLSKVRRRIAMIFALLFGLSSYFSVSLMETIGTAGAAIAYFCASLAVHYVIFKVWYKH